MNVSVARRWRLSSKACSHSKFLGKHETAEFEETEMAHLLWIMVGRSPGRTVSDSNERWSIN